MDVYFERFSLVHRLSGECIQLIQCSALMPYVLMYFFLYKTVFKMELSYCALYILESKLFKAGNKSVLLLMFLKNRLKNNGFNVKACRNHRFRDVLNLKLARL